MSVKVSVTSQGVDDLGIRLQNVTPRFVQLVADCCENKMRDFFGSDLYGPFYGELTLYRLTSDFSLLRLIGDLDYKRLVSSLELKEET